MPKVLQLIQNVRAKIIFSPLNLIDPINPMVFILFLKIQYFAEVPQEPLYWVDEET